MAACSSPESKPASGTAPGPTPAVQRTPIGELPDVDTDAVLAHTKTLSSDEFEGRGPGTKGEELTVAYLVDQFKKIGLKPGNTDGTYIQKVPLVGITPAPAPLTFKKGSDSRRLQVERRRGGVDQARGGLREPRRIRSWCLSATASSRLNTTGTTTRASTSKGKTLVMLVNDPPVPDPANPCRARCRRHSAAGR